MIRTSWSRGQVTHGAFLDVSSAFDKVWHKGLIAKLEQVCVEGTCLKLLRSYLSDRKQVVVLDGNKSNIKDVKAGVPQGSRLGPLMFILYINDILEGLESEVMIFADDTTILATGDNPAETTAIINRDLEKVAVWAKKWKVTFNAAKSRDIIFTKKNFINCPGVVFNNVVVKRVTEHKHLGLWLTPTLDWAKHVHETCLKANRKLYVLRSVKFLKRGTLDVLYKLQIRSCIDYMLPVYFHTLKQTEKSRIEQIQYKAAKLASGALHYTSQIKLEKEMGWESISDRADFLGLTLFRKIHTYNTRPLIRQCMPKQFEYNSIARGTYRTFQYQSSDFNKSFFPYFTCLWNKLPESLKSQSDLDTFKLELKDKIKPRKYKHFSKGNKIENALLTRIRVGRSHLNGHSYTIGLANTPECLCHFPCENTEHYLLYCFLFEQERRTMFESVRNLVPKFDKITKKKQLEILLNGLDIDNNEMNHLNTKLQIIVQKFILQTGRFEHPSTISSYYDPLTAPPPRPSLIVLFYLTFKFSLQITNYHLYSNNFIFDHFYVKRSMTLDKLSLYCF